MADKNKAIKISVAAGALVLGIVLIVMQFTGSEKPPAENEASAAAAQADEAISRAAQESARTVEAPPELPREERKPRTVLGR